MGNLAQKLRQHDDADIVAAERAARCAQAFDLRSRGWRDCPPEIAVPAMRFELRALAADQDNIKINPSRRYRLGPRRGRPHPRSRGDRIRNSAVPAARRRPEHPAAVPASGLPGFPIGTAWPRLFASPGSIPGRFEQRAFRPARETPDSPAHKVLEGQRWSLRLGECAQGCMVSGIGRNHETLERFRLLHKRQCL